MSENKYCTLLGQMVIIEPIMDFDTCTKSLPVADCCKEYKCRYHNSMSMLAFLTKARTKTNMEFESLMKLQGAVDYCMDSMPEPPAQKAKKGIWPFRKKLS